MKLGIVSSAYFGKENYLEGLKNLKKHGYDYYDFQEFISPYSPLYDLNDKELKDYLTKLKKDNEEVGLTVSQLHGAWSTDDTSPEKRKHNIEYYFKKDIIGCNLLGVKNLVVHPVMPYGWGKEDDYQKTLDINYEYWLKLLPFAKDNGVTICLENMPFNDHALNTPKTIVDFIDKVNDENFKMCFDTGHCNVFGLNIYDNIVLSGDRLKVYHIHDNNWNMDVHLYPYQGSIKWDDFIRANREIKFSGVYSLETCPPLDNMPSEVLEDCQKSLFNVLKYIVKKIEE